MILSRYDVFASCLFIIDEGARGLYCDHLASMGPIGESEEGEILASLRMSTKIRPWQDLGMHIPATFSFLDGGISTRLLLAT